MTPGTTFLTDNSNSLLNHPGNAFNIFDGPCIYLGLPSKIPYYTPSSVVDYHSPVFVKHPIFFTNFLHAQALASPVIKPFNLAPV
jgi:hypothetical protein